MRRPRTHRRRAKSVPLFSPLAIILPLVWFLLLLVGSSAALGQEYYGAGVVLMPLLFLGWPAFLLLPALLFMLGRLAAQRGWRVGSYFAVFALAAIPASFLSILFGWPAPVMGPGFWLVFVSIFHAWALLAALLPGVWQGPASAAKKRPAMGKRSTENCGVAFLTLQAVRGVASGEWPTSPGGPQLSACLVARSCRPRP